MNAKIAGLILAWHEVFVALTDCVEDARIVLDQSDRGTLLPDRVREMRGKLLTVRESIPELADLLEELTGETTWPMKVDEVGTEGAPDEEAAAKEEEVSAEDDALGDPAATTEGDYTTDGSTPGAHEVVDEEAAAEVVDPPTEQTAGELNRSES